MVELDGFGLFFPKKHFQFAKFHVSIQLFFILFFRADVSPDVSTDVKSSRVAEANHKVFRKHSIFNVLAYLHNLCSICLQKL
jgi:hypothetical protein